MTTGTATTKIVIVAGQEFSVPLDTDNEAIRAQLLAQGFADVASATISKGKKTVGDVEYPTIEFVKKAGTKGMNGRDLAALFRQVPSAGLPALSAYGPTPTQAALVADLAEGLMTFDLALGMEAELAPALEACYEEPPTYRKEGAALCTVIDALSPIAAAAAPCGW